MFTRSTKLVMDGEMLGTGQSERVIKAIELQSVSALCLLWRIRCRVHQRNHCRNLTSLVVAAVHA